jgi:hypothetical protein
MKIVLLILVFVYLIAFFWFIWKSASQWRWYHMLLTSLVFLLSLPLAPFTAGVLKSRAAWSKLTVNLTERLQKGEKDRDDWINGVPSNPQKNPGLLELQTDLRTINAEVGRVFRDLEVRDRGPNGIMLGKAVPQAEVGLDGLPIEPAPAPADGEGDVAAGPMISEGLIVYGFAEDRITADGPFVPVAYLGQYRIAQSTVDTVTLTPAAPLEPIQLNVAGKAGRWVFYELLPIDSHAVFMAAESKADDDLIFGRPDEEKVRSLMGNFVLPETIDAYLRDGSRANPTDPPETIWVKVRFTKPIIITVDAKDQRSAADGGFYDALGQAVDSKLQRANEDTVSFETGDTLIVNEEWARQRIQAGEAELIDRYYVRPLNSYRLALRSFRENIINLKTQEANLVRQIEIVNEAIALTNDMITKGQQRELNLEKDEKQIAVERAAITSYGDRLETQLADAKREVARLYKANLTGERQLAAIQKRIKQSVSP